MKKIKIIHFVSSLSRSSGVMSVIMNYYRYIDKERLQFDFVYFKDSKDSYKKEIIEYGGETYKVPKPSLNPVFKKEMIKVFNNKNYTALHNHMVSLTFYLSPIAKSNGIENVISHSHTTMYSDKWMSAIRNRILCTNLKRHATHYFACSKAAGEFLYGENSVRAGEVTIVNNAINCDKFKFNESIRKDVRENLNLDGDFVIGHVGRFNEQKNHIFLIDIFGEVLKKYSDAKLVLVGDGPLFNMIQEKIKQKEIEDRVLLLGRRENIHELLQGMDLFLLPSLFEGLPVVGVETQASGLPIVMSKNITSEIGLVNYKYISLKDKSEVWAKEILNMPRKINRSASKNIVADNGFDIKIEAKRLEEIYAKMCKGRF